MTTPVSLDDKYDLTKQQVFVTGFMTVSVIVL